jgi:hypothetical protein
MALLSLSYLAESRVCGYKDAKTAKSFPFLMVHVAAEVARPQNNRALCHELDSSVPAFLDENLLLRILNMVCTGHDFVSTDFRAFKEQLYTVQLE